MSSHPQPHALPPAPPVAERWRSLVLPGLFAALVLGMLFSLGTWQLSRLAWKQGLVAQVDARSKAPAIPLAGREAWGRMSADRDDYRRVIVTGRFRHEAEAYLYHVAGDSRRADPGRPQGQGYFVMTPLVLANGDTVIVNRGFVPLDKRDPATRAEGQVSGEVAVTGLVRYPEPRGAFSAVDDPARRLFYTRDLVAMARAMGLNTRLTAPFSIDADDTPVAGGLPRGGETRLTFANRHLEYALTWFGLALTLIGVFAAFAIQRLRGR
ncbi:MAG: surfeit locus 1 family protein [Xanthobacteraceae bacterium]|nr:MAG: surfeit locus 1 family protein [Xanthobacteraceae bacterium]